jgi:hypothetical protein
MRLRALTAVWGGFRKTVLHEVQLDIVFEERFRAGEDKR